MRCVVAFLTAQHEQVKQLFADVLAAEGADRTEKFTALRRLLAVHETAEEEIVHPRARREISDGERIVDERLNQENEAKQTLAELEKLDVDDPQFESSFREFQADVLEHAESEEHACRALRGDARSHARPAHREVDGPRRLIGRSAEVG